MHVRIDRDAVLNVILGALHVHGTVTAVPHIGGGVAVRITGRTNRQLACRALTRAGFAARLDDAHGTLHVPTER